MTELQIIYRVVHGRILDLALQRFELFHHSIQIYCKIELVILSDLSLKAICLVATLKEQMLVMKLARLLLDMHYTDSDKIH